MPNFKSDVDGFAVNKTIQDICNSQNKNEKNITTMVTIEHDKFRQRFVFQQYVVGQYSSRIRHCVLAMAALDKSLSMVLMTFTYQRFTAVLLFVYGNLFLISIIVCMWFGVPPLECQSSNKSSE